MLQLNNTSYFITFYLLPDPPLDLRISRIGPNHSSSKSRGCFGLCLSPAPMCRPKESASPTGTSSVDPSTVLESPVMLEFRSHCFVLAGMVGSAARFLFVKSHFNHGPLQLTSLQGVPGCLLNSTPFPYSVISGLPTSCPSLVQTQQNRSVALSCSTNLFLNVSVRGPITFCILCWLISLSLLLRSLSAKFFEVSKCTSVFPREALLPK